jgi:hypothetical protein
VPSSPDVRERGKPRRQGFTARLACNAFCHQYLPFALPVGVGALFVAYPAKSASKDREWRQLYRAGDESVGPGDAWL